jgi:hypothetical protein
MVVQLKLSKKEQLRELQKAPKKAKKKNNELFFLKY